MAKKKAERVVIQDGDLAVVIAKKRFNWRFDILYRFEAGGQYTIPAELYNQIKDKVDLHTNDKVQLINEINNVNEEIEDGNQTI